MRLSGWRATSPVRDALGPKVVAVLEPALVTLGAEPDPHVWIVWGDDPGIRYVVMAAVPAGFVLVHVRVDVPPEGPHVTARLVRWSRVQIGEVSVESLGRDRMVLTAQVEGQVIRITGDRVAEAARFIRAVLDGADGRPLPDLDVAPTRRRRRVTPKPSKPVAPPAPAGTRRRRAAAGP